MSKGGGVRAQPTPQVISILESTAGAPKSDGLCFARPSKVHTQVSTLQHTQVSRTDLTTVHQRVHRTWGLPHTYHRRTWAVRYVDQCQQKPASATLAMQAARCLAEPWFAYQRCVLEATAEAHAAQLHMPRSTMHQHLQPLAAWLFPLEQQYSCHRRRVERFSLMCCL